MGQDPDAIRREIEQTRERMGETVDALGYKADVPSRTKEKVTGTVSSVKDRIVGTADSINEATPGTGDVKQAAKRGASVAQENPLGLAIGSIAIGFLAGMLIPTTNVENEKLGPMADTVKDQIKETGQEALEHGKQVAQEVASTAQESVQQVTQDVKETAQQAAQEHGQQVAETAKDNAQQAQASVSS
jgi:gas vesicle protein